MLAADHRIVCVDASGAMSADYLPLFGVGLALFAVWTVGVPLLFGCQLYKHRRTIAEGNQNFAGVAHLRPLFIFLHPSCYMFEVYFMIEKLLLTGVIGVIRVYVG
eukprot:SAG31_NODE_7139_length_1779_cov_1.342262_1_plen_104_part_10